MIPTRAAEHYLPGLLAAGLFAGAGDALHAGEYALGVWLALGCAAAAVWAVTHTLRADRPDTVRALATLDANLGRALREIDGRLKVIEERAQFLATTVTAAFPAATPRGPSPLKSPLRPPFGGQPR